MGVGVLELKEDSFHIQAIFRKDVYTRIVEEGMIAEMVWTGETMVTGEVV
jgi:hypothetical protein